MFGKIKQMIKSKKIEKNLEKKLVETPPIIRYRKIKSIFEISDFIINNFEATKKLLDEKGFSYDKKDRIEKISLLQTEVSELIDAFKKGKGAELEGEELADIIIRLMNIPCIYQDIVDYVWIKKLSLNEKLPNDITMFFNGITKNDSVPKTKYFAAYTMFKIINVLDDDLIYLEHLYEKEKTVNSKIVKETLEKIFVNISAIILICDLYATDILNENLQDLVDNKMAKNYKRPYRYNTAPEMFN